MIVGLGTDIVELVRIEESLQRLGDPFAKRILMPDEFLAFSVSKRKIAFLAKRFCIKEAAAKALGTGIGRGVSWQHMWVQHDDVGAPELCFNGGAEARLHHIGGKLIHVSVSDEQTYATAVVILES